jgi:hypothetical protein
MKKSVLFTIMLAICHVAFAKEVPVTDAMQVARNFLVISNNKSLDTLYLAKTVTYNEQPLCYFLNLPDNKGYIVISGYDQVEPILAYSFANPYDESIKKPPAYIDWMETYYDEIRFVIENNLRADIQVESRWELYRDDSKRIFNPGIKTVEPLITTKWGQGEYYNAMCPPDPDGSGGHTVAGCVAIAMAQIMKYHNWPVTGTGSHAYNHNTYGVQSASFGLVPYNWANMPDTLNDHNHSVATLIYHCGVSVEMDYGTGGSTAWHKHAKDAFNDYFMYDGAKRHLRSSFSDSKWANMIKDDLDKALPVGYRGLRNHTSGGHMWVIDGYQGSDHFHMNWGWHGNDDGYYYLHSLNPGGDNYQYHQRMVRNIKPKLVDPCSQVISFGNGGPENQIRFSKQGNGSWDQNICGQIGLGREQIYSFVAPHDGYYSINVTQATNPAISAYQIGGCSTDNWECIDYVNSPGIYGHGHIQMTAGETCYLLIDAQTTAPTFHTLHLEVPDEPGVWTGLANQDWHTPQNWSGWIIPSERHDVIIPAGTPYKPAINTTEARVKSLSIDNGAELTVGSKKLIVDENMDIHGKLKMNHNDGEITVHGNVNWHPGSTADFTANSTFNVYRNWTFFNGSNVDLGNGWVVFKGSSVHSRLYNHSAASSFSSLASSKTTTAEVILDGGLSGGQPLTIKETLLINAGAGFRMYENTNIYLHGSLASWGNFRSSGTLVLTGTNQTIRLKDGNYLHHLTLAQSGTFTIHSAGSDLDIRGDLQISSGVFELQNRTIHVGGNWENLAGPDAFDPGTGKVVFNGSDNQYIHSSEHFNILEANMGGSLRVNNPAHTVTCNSYHWTSGGLEVIQGTFTALDLAQFAIFGNFKVHPDGTINLHQGSFPVESVDLECHMEFNGGGTINVYGGGSTSRWPFANATLNMSGGVLDFKNQGILISNTGTLNTNITGGVIRTSKNFRCDSPDFDLGGGTLELYGEGSHGINITNQLAVISNVRINKAAQGREYENPAVPTEGITSGDSATEGEHSGSILLNSDLHVSNNLEILSGTVNVQQYALNVGNMLDVHGSINMPNPNGEVFAFGPVRWHPGSTLQVSTSAVFKAYGNWSFLAGSNVNPENGTVMFMGSGNCQIFSHSNTSSFNNLSIYKTGGASTTLSSFSTQPLTVNNNIYVHTGAIFRNHSTNDLILKGNVESNGSFTCQVAKLVRVVLSGANQSLKMNTGDYFFHLIFNQSGTVTINNTHTDILTVKGNVVIQSGLFDMQNNSLHLRGDWTNNIWPAGFDAGTGRVVFNSLSNQTIHTNEDFNRLVADMGGLLQINKAGVTVSCNQYDWKKGGIHVIKGTLTANNLVQNGLYGEFRLQPQGTINIFNPGGWVDLLGQIYNYGGTMNISGGAAWWPYSDDAHLTMTGGVIDMKTCGIYVPAGYSWTYNITGGTIRSAHGFSSNDPNFNLEAGTFEYYGSNTVYIYQNTGLLFSIIINMSAKEGDELPDGKMVDSRSGVLLSDNSRSANVVLETDLIIDGNLDIKSGTLMANDKTISINGNWNNQIFPEGFDAGTGSVVFNGIYNQTCSSENFNILKLNKAGGMLFIPHNTSCALYDWTSGGITAKGGTFTAHDLAQININGTYTVNGGGTINLHQDESHWVDLNANLYINSGTINIYGGAPGSESWWPDVSAFLYISEGVLDFKDQRIFVRDFGDFASIITGGTIRTSKGFRNERTGFDLPAGTLELYGPDNADIYLTQGSSLHNLKINKSGGQGEHTGTLVRRDGTSFENIRSNTVLATSPIVLTNNLDVDDGTFSVNSFQVTTGGDVNVNGTLVVNQNANLSVGAGKRLAVNDQGKLYAVGVKGAEAVITGASKGHYKFDVENSGTLAATDAIFEYMDGVGIHLKPGSLVDPAYPFYSCTFRNGAAGGRLLTLHNNQVFTVHNAHFPANTWGGSHNVFKKLNSGHVTFIDPTGPFAGNPFEYDTHDRVSWGEMHLAVEPAESYVTNAAGTVTIEVISDLPWTMSESVHWFTVSPMSGTGNGTLTVSYQQNTNESQRSGEITISSPNIGDAVATVTQDGTLAHYGILAVDPQSLEETHIITKGITEKLIDASNIGHGLLYYEIDITMLSGQQNTNSEWTIHVFDDNWYGDEVTWTLFDSSWVEIISGGPYLTFGYNDLQTVSVSSSSQPLIFLIASHGPYNDNTPTYTVSCGGETLVSNTAVGGTAYLYFNLNCGDEPEQWLSVYPTSGIIEPGGSKPINVTFNSSILGGKDNDQGYGTYHANIKFTGNNPHIQQPEVIVPVTLHYQEIPNNPQLWAEPPIRYVTPPAGTTTYNIVSNLDWTISHETDWFSVDPPGGSGDKTITVIYDENTAMDARLAEFTLSASGAEDVILSIKQEGTFPLLAITPAEQNVSAPAGTATFELESNNSWTVSGRKYWFDVSPTSGTGNEVLTVNYFENTSVDERSAEIAVEAAGETTAYASLIQTGADVVLSVEPANQQVSPSEGYTSFSLQSNTTWTVSESCDWFTVEPSDGMADGTLMVYYDENPTTTPRSCVITLSAEGVPDVIISVQQDGIPIHLYATPSMQDVGAGTGTTTFDIHSNTSWTVSKDDDWFSVAPVIGSGDETLTVTFEENTSVVPRSGTITIAVEGHFSTNVLLYQAGAAPVTTVEPVVQTVGPEAGSTTYQVESNTSWVASVTEDWLSMNPVNGSGNDPLNVIYEANNSAFARTAEILLVSGGKHNTMVTLIQGGSSPYLDAAPAAQYLDWEGGTTACVIWSNTDWTVSTSDYWLTVTPLNGTNDGILTIDYLHNTTPASRTAEITLAAEGVPDVVLTIHQACLPTYDGILAVQPLSIFETHYELPDVTSTTLSVSNVGGSPLEFDMSIEFDDGYIIPSVKNLYQFYDGEVHHLPGNIDDDDDEIDPESLWLIIFNETWTINPGESIAVQAFFNSENLLTDKETPPYGTYQASLHFYGDNPDIEQPELVVPVVFNFEESVFEPYLEVLPLVNDVDANAGTTTFNVASNTEWTATESEYWLSVEPSSGSGDGTMMVNYDANTSASARSGVITVSAAGVEDVVVTINQAGFDSEVPLNRQVVNENIADGFAECYDAWQSIVVQNFIVQSGGAAYFVAGESILLLPGTHAKAGSYLNAWITTTEEFCSNITLPLVAAKESTIPPLKDYELPTDIPASKNYDEAFFRIYPNPTPGLFTLELLDYEQSHEVEIHIFSMRGTLLRQHASVGERELYFDISEQPSGVYFVRVMTGGRVEVRRVVKRM